MQKRSIRKPVAGPQDGPGRGAREPSAALPSEALRARLRSAGIGPGRHAEAALRGMIAARTGTAPPPSSTPDELAEMVLRLERERTARFVDALLSRYKRACET